MMDFQTQALELSQQRQRLVWLKDFRNNAASAWKDAIWPTRKTEHWKYHSLTGLQSQVISAVVKSLGDRQLNPDFIELDSHRLVFVNGIFDAENSSLLPTEIVRFSHADETQQGIIQQYLGSVVQGSQHLFATLNNALVDEGVLIHLGAEQILSKPIYIVHISTLAGTDAIANQRILLVLEKNSRADLIEHYVAPTAAPQTFVNAVTEIFLQDNAELHHYRLHLEHESVQHIGAVHAELQRAARLRGFTLALGGKLKRIDYQINHRGAGAELDLQGIYLPRNEQLVDYHTNVQHWVPHCTTNEVFRGIIGDSARAIFNGRIYIHTDAQKTLAELSNKNLLTSTKAEINTKPELEIYADDVKCAHGATISQLNEAALFYLQSRGVARAEAEVMMNFGFINELLQQIAEPAVHDYLLPRLAKLFGRDQTLLMQASE